MFVLAACVAGWPTGARLSASAALPALLYAEQQAQAGQAQTRDPLPGDEAVAGDSAAGDDQTIGAEQPAAAEVQPRATVEPVPWSDTAVELEPWQLLAIFMLALALIAAAAVFAYSRFLATRRLPVNEDFDGEWPLPPLVIPARMAPDGADRPRNDLRAPAALTTTAIAPARAQVGNLPLAKAAGQVPPRGRPVLNAQTMTQPVPASGPADQGALVEAGPIRFHRPPEGTLQLLPGRLEILSGNERHEEIRFVRVAGQDAVVTFGRSEGEPHLHIQLQSRTVSRLHASIRFQEGRWYMANLSRTNPVVLNGQQMSGADAVHVALEDGDRIEMGEVVFGFRSR